jgi:hypothetical protein
MRGESPDGMDRNAQIAGMCSAGKTSVSIVYDIDTCHYVQIRECWEVVFGCADSVRGHL